MNPSLTGTSGRIVRARWFQRVILLAILLAGVLAGIETDAELVARHARLLGALDTLVLGLFIIEVLLKLLSHGRRPWEYFKDGWNVFDFTVVALCLLPMDSRFAVVLRLARTLRLLRLVSALPKLQLLVGALIKSFSSMGYVSLLLGLMLYIYAITGVHLFGRHSEEHFGSLPAAFLTLFQTITLDDWRNLFESAGRGSPVVAGVYFISFILLGTMIMLNLFIGIIMNSMEEMHRELDDAREAKRLAEDPDGGAPDLEELQSRIAGLQESLARVQERLSRRG